MDQIRKALALVLEITGQQIDSLDDETMNALTQLLNQANERILQLREQELVQNELQEIEHEQDQVANSLAPTAPAGQPPTGGNVPELQPAPHESSNINAFRYNPENGQLFVKFQDKYPGQDGPVYSYSGVPKNIYEVFARGAVAPKTSGKNAWHTWKEGVAPSHGAAMYALIKQGNYAYQRLS